jgi:RNA polymerase sigma factor (sigma-70 family)
MPFLIRDRSGFGNMTAAEFVLLRKKMLFYSHRKGLDWDTSQLIVDQCFENICRSKKEFDSPEHIRSYLFISVNFEASHYKRKKKHIVEIDVDPNLLNVIQPDPYDESEDQLAYKIIKEAIAQLPPERKKIITYSFVDGISDKKIARLLGIQESTVRSSRRSALKDIRRRLNNMAFKLPEKYLEKLRIIDK